MPSNPPDPEFVCPGCGSSNMVSNWVPPSYSLRCADCGWAAATSRFPPIFEDKTTYKVFLVPKGSDVLRSVEAIKVYRGGTTSQAKQLLNEPQIFLFEGTAVRVFTKIEKLRSEGLNLHIAPHYKYSRSDLMGMNIG